MPVPVPGNERVTNRFARGCGMIVASSIKSQGPKGRLGLHICKYYPWRCFSLAIQISVGHSLEKARCAARSPLLDPTVNTTTTIANMGKWNDDATCRLRFVLLGWAVTIRLVVQAKSQHITDYSMIPNDAAIKLNRYSGTGPQERYRIRNASSF